MKKRLLFIEDLYDFYSNKYKRSTHFSADKSGEALVVQVHGKLQFNESDKNKDGLLPVHLQACHTNLNVNNSNIDEQVMDNALPSFSNRPILGYIHKVITDENPEGQWEFYGHNCHKNEEGELVYDEVPIGIIPESCNAKLVYDKEKDKTYCEVDGYIFEEYSKASEILQREGECAVSVELSIRELSYNAKEKFLNIEDFWFSGVTILGKSESGDDIRPGMTGSNIKLADFSANNNSLFEKYENQMIEFQERLEKLESACVNKYNFKEGGNDETMNIFNDLLSKYGKTIENVDFEYENLSDKELVSIFEEKFGKLDKTFEDVVDDNTDDTDDSADTDNVDTPSDDDDDTDEDDTEEKKKTSDDEDELKKKKSQNSENKIEYSYVVNCETKKFSVSLQEKIYAVQDLVNATYAEADNTYYCVTVYEDYVIMCDWWSGRYFKQSYVSENDNYSLTGDRIEVYAEFVTADEQEELDNMRSNYSVIVSELNTYKSKEIYDDKMTVFEDDAYSDYLDTEEFKALMSKKSVDKYSKEELSEKADATLGKLVKKNKTFSYSEKNNAENHKVNFSLKPDKKKSQAYGTLFKEK